MTTEEFSVEFDTLYNNIKSQSAPGLDEYEKSVFLTKAQEEIVKGYFNPKSNDNQEGFDDSIKRQVDFANIVDVDTPDQLTVSAEQKIDPRGVLYSVPGEMWFPINEFVSQKDTSDDTSPYTALGRRLVVIPLTYEEYARLMSKPYTQPLKRQAWRLFHRDSGTVRYAEIIINNNLTIFETSDADDSGGYTIRYVRRPQPIILESIASDSLTINGVSAKTECELDDLIHREILDRAVELAKIHYTSGQPADILTVNRRNE
jgi:hypothetical protein